MSAATVIAFRGHDLLAAGALRDVARLVWRAVKDAESHVEVMLRLNQTALVQTGGESNGDSVDPAPRTRGRPRLAVVARDAAFRFMNAAAGDLSTLEEVIRALYRSDEGRFRELIAEWPGDIAAYSAQLAFSAVMDPRGV
jgi:hypothetical protein